MILFVLQHTCRVVRIEVKHVQILLI